MESLSMLTEKLELILEKKSEAGMCILEPLIQMFRDFVNM